MSFFFLAFFFAESAGDLTTSVPLTDALTRKSNAPLGRPHFGSIPHCMALNASQMPGDWGGMGGFGIDWYINELIN